MDEIITRDERKVFKQLSPTDKADWLYQMMIDMRGDRALDKKQIAGLSGIISNLEGEVKGIGMRKSNSIDTTDRVKAIMNESIGAVAWAFYKPILSNTLSLLHAAVILWIVYHVFGGKP